MAGAGGKCLRQLERRRQDGVGSGAARDGKNLEVGGRKTVAAGLEDALEDGKRDWDHEKGTAK